MNVFVNFSPGFSLTTISFVLLHVTTECDFFSDSFIGLEIQTIDVRVIVTSIRLYAIRVICYLKPEECNKSYRTRTNTWTFLSLSDFDTFVFDVMLIDDSIKK